jgi:hypothetical protein
LKTDEGTSVGVTKRWEQVPFFACFSCQFIQKLDNDSALIQSMRWIEL